MKIVDIRKYTGEDFKLLRVNSNEIIGCKGIETDTSSHIDFLRYDIENERADLLNSETLITKFYWSSPMFLSSKYIYAGVCRDGIEKGEMIICRTDLESGKVDEMLKLEMSEDYFNSIIFLNEDYFILYANDFPTDEKDYNMYKDLEGEYDIAYLYDMKTGDKYRIKDKRIILGVRNHLMTFKKRNEDYIVFEEAYMEDWEQEECYNSFINKEDYYKDGYRESINIIPLKEFIQSIKKEDSEVPFLVIHKTEVDGWTRYFGMDEDNIYYRVKNFNSGIESIYALNKESLSKKILYDIDFKHLTILNKGCKIKYDISNQVIYMIKNNKDRVWIKGLINNDLDIVYNNEIGNFEGFIENRFLVTSYWEENDEQNYYDNVIIKDIHSEEMNKYNCAVHCYDDLIILY